jgi:hypothetical protein
MSARPLPIPINPALLQHAEERRKSLENLSDQILELTKAIHAMNAAPSPTGPANPQVT